MANKVDIVSRCIERLLPLITKDRPVLKGQALRAQKWCGDHTSDALTTADATIVVTPFLTGVCDAKDEAIVTSALDSLDKLMSHAVVNAHTRLLVADIPALSASAARRTNGDAAATPPATPAAAATADGAAPAADDDDGSLPALDVIVATATSRAGTDAEEVVINIVRTLLTAVAACDARGSVLSQAVHTIIRVLMNTRGSKHTQQTGKASLSQIAGIVQRRTELALPGPDGSEDPAWQDCVAMLRAFADLIDGKDIPRISLGLTLLDNFVLTLDPALVTRSPATVDTLRRVVTARTVALMVDTTPHVSKAAFYLMQHLIESFRHILKREIPPILNFIYVVAERSSLVGVRGLAFSILLEFSKNPELLFDLYRNFDCVTGMHDVFGQFCDRLSFLSTSPMPAVGLAQEESLRLAALSAIGSVAQSIRRFRDANTPSSLDALSSRQNSIASIGASFAAAAAADLDADPNLDTTTFSDLVRQLDAKRRHTAVLAKFAQKPKEGIAAAIEEGLCASDSPEDIARFFRTRGIDKVKVGEYLAANKPEIEAVARAFIGLNDFTGLTIDEAIRRTMGYYKIAGEAQVVDRAMHMFAHQYCAQNPGQFSETDTAFVLAFAIMMLNTDQHSPNVKDKMTQDQFISMNRGIDNGNDLPRPLMEGIYRRIRDNEIRLNDDTVTLSDEEVIKATAAPPKDKKESVGWNPEPCVAKTVERVSALTPFEPMLRTKDAQLSVMLFSVAWPHAHTAFVDAVETSQLATKLTAKAMEGIDRHVHVAASLGNAVARRAFISSLRQLSSVTEEARPMIGPKNVRCIEALVAAAKRDMEHLDDSWADVLLCLSKATRLLHGLQQLARREQGKPLSKAEQLTLDVLTNGLNAGAIDDIFSGAGKISDTALLALVDGLLATALVEFGEQPPRTAAIAQLLQVFVDNRHRPAPITTALWSTLASTMADVAVRFPKASERAFKSLDKFFETLQKAPAPVTAEGDKENDAPHESQQVAGPSPAAKSEESTTRPAPPATFWSQWQGNAVDVLWRAAWQCRDSAVRTHILAALTAVIVRGAGTLHDAWEAIMKIFGLVAKDMNPDLVTGAFFTYQHCLTFTAAWDEGAFMAALTAATAFAAAGNKSVSPGAIEAVEVLAAIARFGPVERSSQGRAHAVLENGDFREFVAVIREERRNSDVYCTEPPVWIAVVTSLASLCSGQPGTALLCCEAVFRTLEAYADVFRRYELWSTLMTRAVAPITDCAFAALDEHSKHRHSGEAPMLSVLRTCLAKFGDLFVSQGDDLADLRVVLVDTVARCLQHRHAATADLGIDLLRGWIAQHTPEGLTSRFDEVDWKRLSILLSDGVRAVERAASPRVIHRAGALLDLLGLAASSNSPVLQTFDATVLPALQAVFSSLKLDARLLQQPATTATLVEFQARTALVALRIVHLKQSRSHLYSWARSLLTEFVAASDREASGRDGHQIGSHKRKALADSVCQLLSNQLDAPAEQLMSFMDHVKVEVCELIRCCDPRIAGTLSILFRRHLDYRSPAEA